ncbi:hypothetical protein D3C73_1556260 [compost metagenome]
MLESLSFLSELLTLIHDLFFFLSTIASLHRGGVTLQVLHFSLQAFFHILELARTAFELVFQLLGYRFTSWQLLENAGNINHSDLIRCLNTS